MMNPGPIQANQKFHAIFQSRKIEATAASFGSPPFEFAPVFCQWVKQQHFTPDLSGYRRWAHGRFGEIAAVTDAQDSEPSRRSIEIASTELFSGDHDRFVFWIGEQAKALAHSHDLAMRDADLETLIQFKQAKVRRGDLGGKREFVGSDRALAGIRGHQKIQRSRPTGYLTEL